eukprot:779224-Prymnesium_polylepis.1
MHGTLGVHPGRGGGWGGGLGLSTLCLRYAYGGNCKNVGFCPNYSRNVQRALNAMATLSRLGGIIPARERWIRSDAILRRSRGWKGKGVKLKADDACTAQHRSL